MGRGARERQSMAIRDWYVRELVVFLVGGIALMGMCFFALEHKPAQQGQFVNLLLVLCMFAVAVTLVIVTWKWLGGRNR